MTFSAGMSSNNFDGIHRKTIFVGIIARKTVYLRFFAGFSVLFPVRRGGETGRQTGVPSAPLEK